VIEETIKYIETLLTRKLTGEELTIVGISYQQGLIEGKHGKGNNLPNKNEKE
jgi:hypothetical protein